MKERLGKWLPLFLNIATAIEGSMTVGPLLQSTLIAAAVIRRAMGAVLRKPTVVEVSQSSVGPQRGERPQSRERREQHMNTEPIGATYIQGLEDQPEPVLSAAGAHDSTSDFAQLHDVAVDKVA